MSSPEAHYTRTSYYIYPVTSSLVTQTSTPQNLVPQVQSRIRIVGNARSPRHTKEESGNFDRRAGPNSSVISTYSNPSASTSVSQASTGPALHLHWQLLSYHVAQPDLFLHFDVAFPIHDIEYRRDSSHSVQQIPLCDGNLDKPAANKELTNMTIKFQRNPMQWDINIKRDEGIRVRDVFEAIYSAFDIPLTPHEKSLIPRSFHAGCEDAFRLRCSLAPVSPIVQQRQGWKRVDTLLHKTLFCGLTRSKSGEDWTLNLSCTNLRTDSNIMDGERLMSDSTALRYWKDLVLTVPIALQWLKDLTGDVLVRQNLLVEIDVADRLPSSLKPVLETTASHSPLPQPSSLIVRFIYPSHVLAAH
jgi:hypothetical protein